ncbi:MAG TPA: hypothetical protein VH858_12805, partial [Hyphomicrobiales bacterium]
DVPEAIIVSAALKPASKDRRRPPCIGLPAIALAIHLFRTSILTAMRQPLSGFCADTPSGTADRAAVTHVVATVMPSKYGKREQG